MSAGRRECAKRSTGARERIPPYDDLRARRRRDLEHVPSYMFRETSHAAARARTKRNRPEPKPQPISCRTAADLEVVRADGAAAVPLAARDRGLEELVDLVRDGLNELAIAAKTGLLDDLLDLRADDDDFLNLCGCLGHDSLILIE